jgi:ribosomal protein L32
MAVPKKRTSIRKKKSRQAVWFNKSKIKYLYALSLGKSLRNNLQKSFTI